MLYISRVCLNCKQAMNTVALFATEEPRFWTERSGRCMSQKKKKF